MSSKGRKIKGNIVGDKVREIREKAGMYRKDLCKKLQLMGVDIGENSMLMIERRVRTVTDVELYHIAEALGVSMYDLFTKEAVENAYLASDSYWVYLKKDRERKRKRMEKIEKEENK